LLRIWALVCAVTIGLLLGAAPLFDADEGRNAEVGREMAETNDYIVPHLDGLPYLDKPIVYFAAEAGAMEVLGPTELAARLPAYLFTLATAVIVFWFARKLWGVDEACVAAIAYLSMPLTIASGVDMPKLAIGEALGTPIPDGPLEFEDLAMVRFFQERFFAFDDIADLQRHAAEIAS